MSRLVPLALACGVISLAAPAASHAAFITDRSSSSTNTTVTGLVLGQSFTPGFDRFGFAQFYLASPSTADVAYTFSLYQGEGISGTRLGTVTSTLRAGSSTLTFLFGSSIPINFGSPYTMVFGATDGVTTTTLLADNRNPFLGGMAYVQPAGGTFTALPSTDFEFTEGYDPTAAIVPEPSSWLLMGLGCGALTVFSRRRSA